MNRMLGFACVEGSCACATGIGSLAPSGEAAANMVLPNRMLRRLSVRYLGLMSGLVSSRSFSVLTTCSSILAHRVQLVLHSFRAGFDTGISCAVAWRLV